LICDEGYNKQKNYLNKGISYSANFHTSKLKTISRNIYAEEFPKATDGKLPLFVTRLSDAISRSSINIPIEARVFFYNWFAKTSPLTASNDRSKCFGKRVPKKEIALQNFLNSKFYYESVI
jgi:hypothetical protein